MDLVCRKHSVLSEVLFFVDECGDICCCMMQADSAEILYEVATYEVLAEVSFRKGIILKAKSRTNLAVNWMI